MGDFGLSSVDCDRLVNSDSKVDPRPFITSLRLYKLRGYDTDASRSFQLVCTMFKIEAIH